MLEPYFDAEVLALMRRLQREGHLCVLVGGAVRDALLGMRPTDYDLATSATPAQLAAALPQAVPTGGGCGTVTVKCGAHTCQITPLRAEGAYTDGRHPDEVHFGATLQQDLARRDLTINAMAWDGRQLTDPFGGQEDLAARRIRTVGSAARRFQEDGLRILRALRFASVLDMRLDEETLRAALACRGQLRAVSLQRVRAELQAALLGRAPQALEAFVCAGGLEWLCPAAPPAPPPAAGAVREAAPAPAGGAEEDAAGTTDLSQKAAPAPAGAGLLAPLAQVPCRMLPRWWAFLTLLGADKKRLCARLGFAGSFYEDMVLLDAWFAAPADRITLKRRAARCGAFALQDALETFAVLDGRFARDLAAWRQIQSAGEPCTLAQLAVGGREMAALGLRGPAVGRRLALLLEAVLAEPALNRRDTLLAMAQALQDLKEG